MLYRATHDEYVVMNERFSKKVQSVNGKVAITADGWSSRCMRGYFVMTLNWIYDTWQMKNGGRE